MPRRKRCSEGIISRAARIEVLERRMLLSLTPAGAEFRANTFTLNSQSSSAIAIDADGDFVVAWQSYQDGSLQSVHYKRISAAGASLGEFRANTTTLNGQFGPDVAIDADGDFVIAWSGNGPGDSAGVFAQRFNAGGTPQGFEFRANTTTVGVQSRAAVAMDADGDFVIAWESNGQDGSGYGVFAQRYNASGVAQGTEFRVNTFTTGNQRFPDVARDESGDFVITWNSFGQEGAFDNLYAQRYNAAGASLGGEFRVNTTSANNSPQPSVAMDADGDFVVVWHNYLSPGASLVDVFARRFNASGVAQGGEFRVNSFTPDDQEFPSVAMDATGDFVVIWQSVGQDDGFSGGIYAKGFNAAGVVLGGEFLVNATTAGSQFGSAVAMDAAGNAIATWTGDDGSTNGVFSQKYAELADAIGPELRINVTTSGDQLTADMAMDQNGEFVVAWAGEGPGDSFGIFARRYNAAAIPLSGEFRVNTTLAGDQQDPAVAGDANGNFVVVWTSDGQDGSFSGIFARRFNAAGVAQGGEIAVNTFTTGNQRLPEVAMDSNGNFEIIWTSTAQDGSGLGVFAQRYNASGVAQGGEFRVNTTTADNQVTGTVAADPTGDFVIVWNSLGQDGSDYGIYAQRYNAAGVAQGGEFKVNTFTLGTQGFPSVATDAAGNFVVAWASDAQDGSTFGIFAQQYDAAGVAQGGEFRVNTSTTNSQLNPSISMDSDGDFVIAWISFDGSGFGVFAQRYNEAAVPQGSEFRVNVTTFNSQLFPAAAMHGDDDFVVIWQSLAQDGSGYGVYAQRYAPLPPPPEAAGPEFQVNTTTSLLQQRGTVAMADNGNFVVSWSGNGPGDSFGIFAQRYNAAGVAQGSEFRVNTFTTGTQLASSVAMDADGDFVIVWGSYGQDAPGNYGVFGQRYNAAGVAQGTEFRVNTFTTDHQSGASVAMDDSGDFVVTWSSNLQDGSGQSVFAQRYNAAGAALGAEFRVNTFTTGAQLSSSVAMDADGDFVIAWSGNGSGDSDAVFAQRFNATGIAQGAEFRVNTFTTGSQAGVSAAMDADGDFVVTWSSNLQDGSDFGVFAQRYDAEGFAQGAEFRVNTATADRQVGSVVASAANGDFAITWSSRNQDGSGYGVYAQRYNSAGVRRGGEFRVNSFTTNNQLFPALAMESDGDFVVVWSSYEQDGSQGGIFAQRYASESAAPEVADSSFLFETAPHRLRFTFDQDVSASLGTNDIVLENLTTSTTIPSSDLALSYDIGTNTATFTYIGPGASVINDVLPDGNYRATLLASGITNANGQPLAANHVFTFFFLNGDANHDARVNLDDFNILAANFGQSPRDFTQADFTYDTIVNLDDFNVLASRFGVALGPEAFGQQRVGGIRDGDDLRELLNELT